MLRKFFIWRAEKKMGRSHYGIDRRHYKGVFTPGFFAHLDQTKFWQSDNDPYQRSRKRRNRILAVMAVLILATLAWVIFESSRALTLF